MRMANRKDRKSPGPAEIPGPLSHHDHHLLPDFLSSGLVNACVQKIGWLCGVTSMSVLMRVWFRHFRRPVPREAVPKINTTAVHKLSLGE